MRDNPPMLVSWVLWVILSICLHELGHGVAAIWQGDDTPIKRNRMTLNPLVHMGTMSLIAFAFIGIAWGQMPVNPSRFRWGRIGDAVVSAAGPAVNVILALISLTAFAIIKNHVIGTEPPSNFVDNLGTFFMTGGMLNIALAMLNLIPVPPLDGSHILGALSQTADRLYRSEQFQRMGIIIFLLVLYFLSGEVFGLALNVTGKIVDLLVLVV